MLPALTRVALVGNPNSGKTTLFNALTGGNQRVANWPGVTVVRKTGYFQKDRHGFTIVDLPGTYAITHPEQDAAPDAQLTAGHVVEDTPDVLINVVSANHLERHLYLTMQLLEMGLPMVMVLNMVDECKQAGRCVDAAALSRILGCPVIPTVASKGEGLLALQKALCALGHRPTVPCAAPLPKALDAACDAMLVHWPAMQRKGHGVGRAACLRLLEGDCVLRSAMPSALAEAMPTIAKDLQAGLDDDVDIVIADLRYQRCAQISAEVVSRVEACRGWSARIDRWVLNRWLGIPLFLGVMYVLFVVTMGLGGVFQDFFDWGSEALFVMGVDHWLSAWHAPTWLHWVLPQGVGRGLNTALAFIPVLFALFFCLGVLDQSGYMARGAMVVDRLLRRMGLPGKSFVPMIVGFGCNVPAVMATRSLTHQRERIVTMLMAPFMSCGARLAIFAVFTSAFFRHGGALVIFALYLIGIVVALVTGWLLHHTLLCGEPIPAVMELPPYRWPALRRVVAEAGLRLRRFLWRAIKVIVPVCVLLSVMAQVDFSGRVVTAKQPSAVAQMGHGMTAVLAPMGVRADNWPASVGLLTGVLAKEVVIGALNSLYDQLHGVSLADRLVAHSLHWRAQWLAAWRSIPNNLRDFPRVFSHPLTATAPMQRMDPAGTLEMVHRFGSPEAAFAYMLFVLLYFPCISTLAAMVREMHSGWAYFSVFWSFLIAYVVAVLFYQTATVVAHPGQTLAWWGILLGVLAVFFAMLRYGGCKLCCQQNPS